LFLPLSLKKLVHVWFENFQVTSVNKRETRGTFLSLGLRPRLQKSFLRFPFIYLGNLEKSQTRCGQIFPQTWQEQLSKQNTIFLVPTIFITCKWKLSKFIDTEYLIIENWCLILLRGQNVLNTFCPREKNILSQGTDGAYQFSVDSGQIFWYSVETSGWNGHNKTTWGKLLTHIQLTYQKLVTDLIIHVNFLLQVELSQTMTSKEPGNSSSSNIGSGNGSRNIHPTNLRFTTTKPQKF